MNKLRYTLNDPHAIVRRDCALYNGSIMPAYMGLVGWWKDAHGAQVVIMELPIDGSYQIELRIE